MRKNRRRRGASLSNNPLKADQFSTKLRRSTFQLGALPHQLLPLFQQLTVSGYHHVEVEDMKARATIPKHLKSWERHSIKPGAMWSLSSQQAKEEARTELANAILSIASDDSHDANELRNWDEVAAAEILVAGRRLNIKNAAAGLSLP
jgi:hypothetical protein